MTTLLEGETKTFDYKEPDWTVDSQLNYVKLTAASDDAWFPDYLDVKISDPAGT
eukprot:CAMPEP_0177258684 /NCGR_PEP_ID=MMETSP0367-20130122/58237_1 /TAXON_ID=447022 ORGANISM="Scrippsiella hangoei-like, Strain SHHI-4" /NCGR_SAMPLE_ID=MMETSP0367 /ASSEMBLY_ACC=CAM_ASM_000362 /LENGTH=53 /DNA_ID=CAMNT_0018712913 /DNA_START=57 /DNA_END=215 /DNA_ORIENTATION=-